jgi:hypothetical protein
MPAMQAQARACHWGLMVRKSQRAERILRPKPARRRFFWLIMTGSADVEEEEAAPGDDTGLIGVRGWACNSARISVTASTLAERHSCCI